MEQLGCADYCCALEREGTVACWGDYFGECAGQPECDVVAAAVEIEGLTKVSTIVVGGWIYGLQTDGELKIWGDMVAPPARPVEPMKWDGAYELASPDTPKMDLLAKRHPDDIVLVERSGYTDPSPVGRTRRALSSGFTGVEEIEGGSTGAVCMRFADQRWTCLSGSETLPDWYEHEAFTLPDELEELQVFGNGGCARLSSEVRCWTPTDPVDRVEDRQKLGLPMALAGPATQLHVGPGLGCAILVGGDVQCWSMSATQDRAGHHPDRSHIYDWKGAQAVSVATRRLLQPNACVLDAKQQVRCRSFRVVFDGADAAPISSEETLVELDEPARALIGGDYQFCAVLESGRAQCWGANIRGSLGNGSVETTDDTSEPTYVLAAN